MPIPPTNSQISARTVTEFTVGKGLHTPQTTSTTQTASLPVANPPALIGVDAASFTLVGGGNTTVTFPNLVVRTPRANPVALNAAGSSPITVHTTDLLIMDLSLQGSSAWVTFTGYALLNTNQTVPGPFFGSNTYQTFGATISGPTSTSGIIVAKLYLQRG